MTPARTPDEALRDIRALAARGWLIDAGEGTVLGALLAGLADEVSEAERLAERLTVEVDPGSAVAMLPDYERVLGPAPCGDPAGLTLSARQARARQRWVDGAGASRAFFIGLAAAQGVTITIAENRVTQASTGAAGSGAVAGDELVLSPEQHVWQVSLPVGTETIAVAGGAQAGDLIYDLSINDVECDIRRLAPAHTTVCFLYTGA